MKKNEIFMFICRFLVVLIGTINLLVFWPNGERENMIISYTTMVFFFSLGNYYEIRARMEW